MFRASSKGQALVVTMLIMAALLAAAAIFMRAVVSEKRSSELNYQKERAYYLAEAGIEEAKSIIASNPVWFTDAPHSPDYDTNWLIDPSKGSLRTFGGGSYRIVRESGKDLIYSIGTFKEGKAVLSIKFHASPFSSYGFKIL